MSYSSYCGTTSTASRYSRARQRAAEASSSLVTARDNSRSVSRARARSEFHRDSPAASPCLPGRGYGVPDYRSTSVDIRTVSPCRGAGGYYPRTTKRTISITSLHHNDQVPLYTRGHDATSVTQLEDVTTAYPSLDRETLLSPTSSSASGVGRGLSTPYSPYQTSFYSSHNTDSGNFRPARFRETTPLRYSSTPRISSRFL